MLRRSPLNRKTPLRPKRKEPGGEREPRPMALSPASRRGSYSGGVSGEAVSKPTAARNPALLEMARGRVCLLRVPGVCVGATETTVAAHSNLLAHGKAKSRKADDCYSVWACFACHCWLDNGHAGWREKEDAFLAAHVRQADEWRRVAGDSSEPPRFRAAALWALDRLKERG